LIAIGVQVSGGSLLGFLHIGVRVVYISVAIMLVVAAILSSTRSRVD
jgi:hypothetical protein